MKSAMAACAAIVLLAACNPQPENRHAADAAPSPTPSGMPALKITGKGAHGQPVRSFQQSGNRKLYSLVAQSESYTSHSSRIPSQTTFAQPTVTFYAKDGTTMTAHAPTASVADGKQMVLSGGVHATTSSGLTLACDQLTYDQSRGVLHGTGNVRITGRQGGQEQVLTGNSFTSDVKLTKMVMK